MPSNGGNSFLSLAIYFCPIPTALILSGFRTSRFIRTFSEKTWKGATKNQAVYPAWYLSLSDLPAGFPAFFIPLPFPGWQRSPWIFGSLPHPPGKTSGLAEGCHPIHKQAELR